MNSIAQRAGAIGVALIAAIYPQKSVAQGLDGSIFAAWPVANQDSYIETSVMMAGVVLAQTHPSKSHCINDWYFAGTAWQARNPEIRKMIAAHGSAHPSGVILAMIFQECGRVNP